MIVIARRPGYLANSLLHFAHFIAVSLELDVRMANPAFSEYGALFDGSRADPWCRFPQKRREGAPSQVMRDVSYWVTRNTAAVAARAPFKRLARSVRIDWDEEYDLQSADFQRLAKATPFLFIEGWDLRAEDWVIKHREPITRFFQPAAPYAARVERILQQARQGNEVLVGVHARQGDYATFEGGRHFFELAQFRVAMKIVLQKLAPKKVGFLVCSNVAFDPRELGPSIIRGTDVAVEDLYALAGCDYLIGPKSTFTMWASYYGGPPRLEMHKGDHGMELLGLEQLPSPPMGSDEDP